MQLLWYLLMHFLDIDIELSVEKIHQAKKYQLKWCGRLYKRR